MLDTMQIRYIVIRVTLNDKVYPSQVDENGQPANVKIIRANTNNDTLTADVRINKLSGFTQSDCTAIINGMLIDDINAMIKVNSFTTDIQTPVSYIEVFAGYEVDADGYPPLVYSGDIWESSPDFNAENRSRPLIIKSLLGWEQAGKTADSISIKDKISLSSLFQLLANNFNTPLNPVSLSLQGTENQYAESVVYSGSALQQLQQACADYGFSFKWDDSTLLIAPIGEPMREQIITISPDDNLLGYPTASGISLTARVRFTPAIRFGTRVKLDTSIEAYSTGYWYVNGLSHHLTNRDRDWTTTLQLNRFFATEGA